MRLWAVSLISAAALSYEVLLTRLLAIVHWHHFAYMVISLALLGYGASGTYLALARRHYVGRPRSAFAGHAMLFALTAVAGFEAAQRLPFNALAIFWEPEQLLWLGLLHLIFVVPFFFAAGCIGIALAWFPERTERVYRQDLAGAGIGAAAVILALLLLPPKAVLVASAALALLAAILVGNDDPAESGLWRRAVLSSICGLAILPAIFTDLVLSEFKGLAQAQLRPGARIIGEYSGPLGLVTVVESDAVPFRHAPGLSLMAAGEPPPQLGVFIDGDGMTAITRFDGTRAPLAYLDGATAALPYHLLKRPRVLVLDAGGGAEVLRALYHQAQRIDAVEQNPDVVRLLGEVHHEFAGRLHERADVAFHIGEARNFVARQQRRFDLIQLSHADTPVGVAGALGENYAYTVEAFGDYLARLAPGGYLAITRPLKLPPRDSLKLIATARDALLRSGVDEPERHIALIRSWGTTTLLVKRDHLQGGDIDRIRTFAKARAFDLAYYPGLRRAEANQFNLLATPAYFDGATALLGPEADWYRKNYPFDLRPARDDRPYFFDFFKWRGLPEMLRISRVGGAVLIDWGHLILVATMFQAVILSLVLVLLPLFWRRPEVDRQPWRGQWIAYFALIGAAFLLLEIASMQRFVLFLGHPFYAIAVVLAAFLVFAGIGSGLTPRLVRLLAETSVTALDVAVILIAFAAAMHVYLVPIVFDQLISLPIWVRIIVTLVLIGPLALPMGIPFPLALSRIKSCAPDFVPWAWSINGCASVVSAVLATLAAMLFGFAAVILLAVLCYLLAAISGRQIMKLADTG